jgi:hypothetical protein
VFAVSVTRSGTEIQLAGPLVPRPVSAKARRWRMSAKSAAASFDAPSSLHSDVILDAVRRGLEEPGNLYRFGVESPSPRTRAQATCRDRSGESGLSGPGQSALSSPFG